MSSRYRLLVIVGIVSFAAISAACDDGVSPPQEFAIGGIASGIQNGNLVLRINGNDDISLVTDGGFQFPNKLPAGASYSIAVAITPPGQVCQVSNGSGTVGQADIDDVVVECQLVLYKIGGFVSAPMPAGVSDWLISRIGTRMSGRLPVM